MVDPIPKTQTLPKTTEGATDRYFHTLETHYRDEQGRSIFQGLMFNLKNNVRERIFRLHREVPQFYDERLPTLVNQATAALLSCDANSSEGVVRFHQTHMDLLGVLDRLTKYQPPGEIDFQIESYRDKKLAELEQELVKFRANAESILHNKIQEEFSSYPIPKAK